MPTELPNRITSITPDEAAQAISEGYKRVTGSKPTVKILGLLLGQWALETGNGKSVHNYNYGNAKATSGDEYYQYFRCSEIVGGVEMFYDPPHPACKFSAFRTSADGAEAYIKLLKRREHWWKGLQTGTVDGFIKGLTTAPAYFTASPSLYTTGLRNRMENYSEFAKKYGSSGVFGQIFAGLMTGAILVGGAYFSQHPKEAKKYLKQANTRIKRII